MSRQGVSLVTVSRRGVSLITMSRRGVSPIVFLCMMVVSLVRVSDCEIQIWRHNEVTNRPDRATVTPEASNAQSEPSGLHKRPTSTVGSHSDLTVSNTEHTTPESADTSVQGSGDSHVVSQSQPNSMTFTSNMKEDSNKEVHSQHNNLPLSMKDLDFYPKSTHSHHNSPLSEYSTDFSPEKGEIIDSPKHGDTTEITPPQRLKSHELPPNVQVLRNSEYGSKLVKEVKSIEFHSQSSLPEKSLEKSQKSTELPSVRLSRETQSVLPEGEDKTMNMEALVKTLQTQLVESQTSQARTRSILNTIQERQVAQERDLSSLKSEISSLRHHQDQHQGALVEVKGQISDTAWAVKDLKASMDQIRADFGAFKLYHGGNNQSLVDIEEGLAEAEDHQFAYTEFIKRLSRDVQHLKTSFATDHEVMTRIKRLMTSLDWASRQMTKNHDHTNNIPLGSGTSDYSGSQETSATNTNSYNRREDLEEADNSLGHNIVELHKHKHHMHMQVENLNRRFLQYDAEMSRVYAMYYNLSLQIAGLENKLLSRQHQTVDTDMAAMQRFFVNFTNQLFSTEHQHLMTKAQLNATQQNEQQLQQLSSSVENHQMRIHTLENLLVDYRSTNQDFRQILSAHLASMNASVHTVRGRFKVHKTKASLSFSEVAQRLGDMWTELKDHDKRILKVEVHMLNDTLSQCKKTNDDLVRNIKVDQLRSDFTSLATQVDDHSSKINRHDRSMGAIFKEVQGNNQLVSDAMKRSQRLFDLVPRTTTLENEISKLLMHLPTDCAAPLSEPGNRDGLYLIKPHGSLHSLQVFCQTDPMTGSPWLVVQRRTSGKESFARTWDEYRDGFGSPDGEFWIGNENLNRITSQAQYRLAIDLWDINNVYYSVEYEHFHIESADTNYRLVIDGYHGNATDALRYSNYMAFSTIDQDHDVSSTHCAKFYTSGWWYKHCHYSNLNGRYTVGVVWFNHDFDEWIQMKHTIMKVQAVNATRIGR